MNKSAEQCNPDQIWVPGMLLDYEYPVPTNQELETAWAQYRPDGPATAVTGVFGVYTAPAHKIQAIASIDLCEVIRDTVGGLHAATGVTSGISGEGNFYSHQTWFDAAVKGSAYEGSVVTSVLQVLMNEGYVKPVETAPQIAAMLRRWREQGIFTVANTSTLPGCEIGTIKHTLSRDVPGGFDALVLPRNYDGNGPVTKAAALSIIAAEVDINLSAIPFVHIDDAPHHIQGFQTYYPDSRLQLFVPRHNANGHLPIDLYCDDSLEAFEKANKYFVSEGVIDAW